MIEDFAGKSTIRFIKSWLENTNMGKYIKLTELVQSFREVGLLWELIILKKMLGPNTI